MKSPKEFGEYLDTLIAKAPALRAAGVLNFETELFGKVLLNPNAGSLLLTVAPNKQSEGSEGDPMENPLSYGLAPGETLPWQETDGDRRQ